MIAHSYLGESATVIVTGAAGGVGAATANRLANDGHLVVCTDINGDRLEATVAEITGRGGAAIAAVGDVRNPDDCTRVVAVAAGTERPVRGLVNNAAVGAYDMSVETTSLDVWNDVIATNLTSVFLMSRCAIPLMRAVNGGVIVNVSSIHAFATSERVAPYAAAKGGVLALTRNMALDLAMDCIRVTCLVPGAIDTPMLQAHADRENKTLPELGFPEGNRAIGRVASPSELAGAIAFLLSRDATFVTGSALVADGGILAKF